MNALQKLTELFGEFPGIGPRQAKRFAYFLLTRPSSYRASLIEEINKLKNEVRTCTLCFRFFSQQHTSQTICTICSGQNRTSALLMIVSRDVDLETIEKSQVFNGLYFVLGGTVPILEKDPTRKVRSNELLERIEKQASSPDGLSEVILAMNANPEGDNTAYYIRTLIEPLREKYSFKISVLGRGLSTGTELEYSDSDTLKNALENRHAT